MTVLSAVQSAATVLGMDPIPDDVFGATTREMVEMKVLVNEVARQVAEAHDWSVLKGIHTITGDGSDTDFALPSDYDRMGKDSQLWSSANTTIALEHVRPLNDWLALTAQGYFPTYGAWIVYGGEIHIMPARAAGETVKFAYVSNKIVAAEGGTPKAEFSANTDVFRLPERLLTLAIIWAWKSKKGIDYAEEMATYQENLAQQVGKDRGPAILTVGRQRYRGNAGFAYPGVLG